MARSKNLSLQDLQEIHSLLQGLPAGSITRKSQFDALFKLCNLIAHPTYGVKRAGTGPQRPPEEDVAYKYGLYFQNNEKHDVSLHEKVVKMRAQGHEPDQLAKCFGLKKAFINQLVYIHKRYHNGCQPLQGRRGRPRKSTQESA